MRAKVIDEGTARTSRQERTFALIFDKGDEVITGLNAFAREHSLNVCHFTAIGAFSDLTVGFFDWEKKDYAKIPIRDQVEVRVHDAVREQPAIERRGDEIEQATTVGIVFDEPPVTARPHCDVLGVYGVGVVHGNRRRVALAKGG